MACRLHFLPAARWSLEMWSRTVHWVKALWLLEACPGWACFHGPKRQELKTWTSCAATEQGKGCQCSPQFNKRSRCLFKYRYACRRDCLSAWGEGPTQLRLWHCERAGMGLLWHCAIPAPRQGFHFTRVSYPFKLGGKNRLSKVKWILRGHPSPSATSKAPFLISVSLANSQAGGLWSLPRRSFPVLN